MISWVREYGRKTTLYVAGMLLAAGCNSTPRTEGMPARPDRPNVLFILVDDLGYGDIAALGSQFHDTPNVDRLAATGTVFSQGYANSRVCSPSRASILTGTFTPRHGITDWIGARTGAEWRKQERYNKLLPATYVHQLDTASTTLAEAFREAGYHTFFAGKWHLGGDGSLPTDHGFETNLGGWEKGSPMGGYFSPWENPYLPNREAGENLSLRLARETSGFIEENADRPFLAYLSFYAVHGPIQTTRERWARYRDRADSLGIDSTGFRMGRFLPIRQVQDNPVYAGLVETMDQAVGIVLDQLSASGIADNTIVVFTSDNGGVVAGDDYSTSLKPLQGGKGYAYEGGLRVPFLVRVPWLPTPARVAVPVTGADLFPTLLDLAGLPLRPEQHRDGKSLRPLLRDSIPADFDTRPLIWHYPHYGNQGGEPASVIRQGPWKLIHYHENGEEVLYHLDRDPSESMDLAGEAPDRARQLHEQLFAYLAEQEARFPETDPAYDSLRERRYLEDVERDWLPVKEKERLWLLDPAFDPGNNWWGSEGLSDN